jgi:hypothetical protein
MDGQAIGKHYAVSVYLTSDGRPASSDGKSAASFCALRMD